MSEERKGRIKLTKDRKYNEWLQKMGRADFHYKRGYSRIENDSSIDLEIGNQKLSSVFDDIIEHEVFESTSAEHTTMKIQSDIYLKFVQSSEQISDIKKMAMVSGKSGKDDSENIWKDRLRTIKK